MKKIYFKDTHLLKWKTIMRKIIVFKDYFLVLEKMIFGIISHSSFMWMNALYSCFLGTARNLCIQNETANLKKQYQSYVKISILLILASIMYGIYNSIELFSGKTIIFHEYISIGIAAFTFFEFGFSMYELIKSKKIKDPISKSLIYINFSSICTSFVLTQVVLTSMHPEENFTVFNGLSAVIFSTIIFMIGFGMFIKRKKIK